MAYREAFWVTVGTAASVLLLGAGAFLGQAMRLMVQQDRLEVRRGHLLLFAAAFAAGFAITAFFLAIFSLFSRRDISAVLALVCILLAYALALVATVLSLSAVIVEINSKR